MIGRIRKNSNLELIIVFGAELSEIHCHHLSLTWIAISPINRFQGIAYSQRF